MTNVVNPPVITIDLFPDLHTDLLNLLNSLTPEEWNAPTVCEGWSVKDIAQHLLGDYAGILSGLRDSTNRSFSKNTIAWDDLVSFINQNNDLWVKATRRLSTRVLCSLLNSTGQELTAFFQTLDPFALSVPVSWVSPDPAPGWLEIAREYTEFWTHQQHIRNAVNKPGLKEQRFFYPLLASFVLALPRPFQTVDAPEGTLFKLVIAGEAGGEWFLLREGEGWTLYSQCEGEPTATVTLDGETAWRLFTRGIPPEQAQERAHIAGDLALGQHFFQTISMIA